MTNPKHTSSDLVEWLRRTVYRNSYYKDDTRVPVNPDGPEAADRIEALEAENERLTARVAELEAVLKRCAEIVRLHNNRQNEKVEDVIYLARAALQEISHDRD